MTKENMGTAKSQSADLLRLTPPIFKTHPKTRSQTFLKTPGAPKKDVSEKYCEKLHSCNTPIRRKLFLGMDTRGSAARRAARTEALKKTVQDEDMDNHNSHSSFTLS